MSRHEFLARVKQAVEQGKAYKIPVQEHPDNVGYVGCSDDLCTALVREINAVGGRAYRAATPAAAIQLLHELCQEMQATQALCWEHELLEQLGIYEQLEQWNITPLRASTSYSRAQALQAEIGITSVSLAVAETGSLFMWAKPGQERMASLLPKMHVAIVSRDQIVPDLYDAITQLNALGIENLPSNATFITGPSKTGDMELQLTTGVHGPGFWRVIVIG
jgi:L-lactate dehydrogenase complex protein LldG